MCSIHARQPHQRVHFCKCRGSLRNLVARKRITKRRLLNVIKFVVQLQIAAIPGNEPAAAEFDITAARSMYESGSVRLDVAMAAPKP